MIASLQSWRFIFALMIFLHHFPVNGKGLFEAGGSCGVSFFLILSGFVMAAGYGDKVLSPSFSFGNYMIKRGARIYPLHFLCFLVALVLAYKNIDGFYLLKLLPNLLLLQSWIPIQGIYFSGNAVSWCLSDLVFFYAIFPLLVRSFFNSTLKHSLKFASVLFISYWLIFPFIPEEKGHAWLYISPAFRLLDFVLGILLYSVYRYLYSTGKGKWLCTRSFGQKSLLEILAVIFLVFVICIFPLIPEKFYYASYYWLPVSLLILLFSLFNISGGVISRFLNQKWMVYLGNISFSIYMIHTLGISILNALFDKAGLDMIGWQIRLPLFLLAILAVAVCVNKYYEKPVANWLNKKIRK